MFTLSGILPRNTPHVISRALTIQKSGVTLKLSDLWRESNLDLMNNYLRYSNGIYSTHIRKSREFMLQAAPNFEIGDKTVILGPGFLEPIAELCEKSGVALIDKDEETLKATSESLPPDRVRLIKFDLSYGFYAKAEELIEKELEQETFSIQSLERLIQAFSRFVPKETKLPEKSMHAAYVISSGVASQLPAQVEKVMTMAYERRYGIKFSDVFKQNPKLAIKYNYAFERLRKVLPEKHFKDLEYMTKPGGTIFFADYITCNKYPKKTSISSEVTDKLNTQFKVCEMRVWQWLFLPETDKEFGYHAFHLQNKKKD